MGAVCSRTDNNVIDEELVKEITEAACEACFSIPAEFKAEVKRIVSEMERAAPSPYQGLLYSDYPSKNATRVNALARQNMFSNAVKKQIVDTVNKKIEKTIETKTESMNSIERGVIQTAVKKAVEKAVEQVVDRAVDEVVNAINREHS